MSIQEVIASCDQLTAIHEKLAEMGEEKKKLLIGNHVERLSELVRQETKLLKEMAAWDEKRMDAMRRYCQTRGIPEEPAVTVSELAETVERPEEKKALLASRDRLLDSIRRLKEINALNQKLIEQSLSYIHFSLDLLTGAVEQNWIYQNPGRQGGTAQALRMFDTKA